MAPETLPIPPHYDPREIGTVWRVDYQKRAAEADTWRREHAIAPASRDVRRVALLLIDVQNTFCIPDFELYVGGTSGFGAVDDNHRLCEFIYRNIRWLTEICPTMDTHQAAQIFHSLFLVDADGNHPPPYAAISQSDIETGVWRFNTDLAAGLKIDSQWGQDYLKHYVRRLAEKGKYDLTIWPYHAMLGGIGHALVSAVEEAIFFHGIARVSQPDFQVKGANPFTENYSVLKPEVDSGPDGERLAAENSVFLEKLLSADALIVAGQAKSHCVAWTLEDLLQQILSKDPGLAKKVYLLEDCTSPVVIPDVIDYTQAAEAAFERFADAGMHRVRSTDPLTSWPGFDVDG